MKKLIALTVLATLVASNNDAFAATKKKKVKRNSAQQTTTAIDAAATNASIEQKVSSKQAAITEAGAPADKSKTKFSGKYYGDISTSRNSRADTDANAINGYSFLQEVGAAYKFTDVDSLSLTTRVVADKNRVEQADGSYNKTEGFYSERTYLNYTRSSILNEKDHGIDIAGLMHVRYLSDAQGRKGSDGLIRPGLSITKTWDKFSTNVGLFRAQYYRSKDSQKNDYYNYVTVAPAYQITDDLSAGLLIEYVKVYGVDGNVLGEQTDLAASVTYNFSPTVTGDFYLDNDYTMIPGDAGDLFQKDWTKQVNIGAAVTVKLF